MKKQTFPFPSVAIAIMTVFFGLMMSVFLPDKQVASVHAQEETCEVGQATIDIPVVCWAVDAAIFAADNDLFSIVNEEDVRDAVKHYRFYQLVMSQRK